MSENKSFFSQTKIKSHLYTLNSIDDKINYLKSQLKIYEEIYSHESDYQIKQYIQKHKIGSLVRKGIFLSLKNIDSIIDLTEYDFSKFNHLSYEYKNFQYQMLLLIRYAEKLLSDYEFTVTVFDDNFKICFDKDELYKIIYSYEDDIYSAFGWVSIEHDKISGIIKHYNFELFEKIQIKYKVSQYVFVKDNKVVINRSTHPQSSFFKERLVTVLLPAIEYFIDELDFKITLNTAFYKYPDQFEDVEDKFPLFKYDFQYANSYCESIFKLIEEKIEYFSHIILSYNLTHKQDSANAEKNKSAILPFEQKLAHLKTVYELNHNKEKPITPNINIDTSGLVKGINHIIEKIDDSTAKSEKKKAPDTQAFGGLIKEYFEVAQKVFGVPKLEDLASNKYSVPTWSKMFDNKVFLYVLSQRIEKKLNNKRINAITKEIYIKLKLDIDSKIEIATSTDKSKSGQTSRRNKGFNENNYQSEDDDDSNSY